MSVDSSQQATRDRFLSKVEVEQGDDPCWRWTGCIGQRHGYSQFRWTMADGTRSRSGHRFAYTHFRGPIPDGLVLDHLCRNRWCVNPWHLEPVTTAVNILRGQSARFGQWVIAEIGPPRPGAHSPVFGFLGDDGTRVESLSDAKRFPTKRHADEERWRLFGKSPTGGFRQARNWSTRQIGSTQRQIRLEVAS